MKGVAEIEPVRAHGPKYDTQIAGGGTGLRREFFFPGAYAFVCSSATSQGRDWDGLCSLWEWPIMRPGQDKFVDWTYYDGI